MTQNLDPLFLKVQSILNCDHALTPKQLLGWCPEVSWGELQERCQLQCRQLQVRPYHKAPHHVTIWVVSLPRFPLQSLTRDQVNHLLGTAGMRWALQAAPQDWDSKAQDLNAPTRPDAIWMHPDGRKIAIEYDFGTYSRQQLDRKFLTFGWQFTHTYHGCSRKNRQQNLQRQFPASKYPWVRWLLIEPHC